MQQPWAMETATRSVSLDAATFHLQSEHEVDSAIDTVVTFAFGNAEPLDRYLFRIRAALPPRPSVKELVEAVFRVRGELGPITDERHAPAERRAGHGRLPLRRPSELGLPAAMFRLGREVWLTPSRTPPS